MRERMLFLSAQNTYADDLEGEIRTGNILEILQGKFNIDLLTYGNAKKELSVNDGTALKVHNVEGGFASRRSMLGPLYKLRNYSYLSKADKDMRATLTDLCRTNEYGHVYISHSLLGKCIDIIRQLLPKASIITDTYRFESEQSFVLKSGNPGLSNPYYKLNAALVRRNKRRLMNKTGVLLATSEWDALSFKSLSFEDARKVHIVPHFINMNEYAYTEPVPKDNSMVLHLNVNTIQGVKAAQRFYRKVYPLIKEQIPNIRCYIVSREVHPELAPLLAGDESVEIIGALNQAADCIRRAKVVVAPALEGSGNCMNVLESWALRTPVVTSSKVCERLSCEHNRNVILANSSVDIAAGVVTLLKNPELGVIIADRAHQTLLKYNEVNKVKDKILSLV